MRNKNKWPRVWHFISSMIKMIPKDSKEEKKSWFLKNGWFSDCKQTTHHQSWQLEKKDNTLRDQRENRKPVLPWWRSGWEAACHCGRRRFDPWSGRIPHAGESPGPAPELAKRALKTTSHHYGSLWAPELGPCDRRRCDRKPVPRDRQQPPPAAAGESLSKGANTQSSRV